MKVGIGMISRGEVADRCRHRSIFVSSGVLTSNIYTTVIIMVALTAIITPIWLKVAYRKDATEPNNTVNEITT